MKEGRHLLYPASSRIREWKVTSGVHQCSLLCLEGPPNCSCPVRYGMQVKIGPNTQENDLRMKLDKAKEMVQKLYRVRLFIPYRMKDREAAVRMLQRLREICTDFANVAGPEGIEKLPANTVVVYLSPKT